MSTTLDQRDANNAATCAAAKLWVQVVHWAALDVRTRPDLAPDALEWLADTGAGILRLLGLRDLARCALRADDPEALAKLERGTRTCRPWSTTTNHTGAHHGAIHP